MKHSHSAVFFLIFAAIALPLFPALASNKGVDAVLENRPDISLFRDALIKTGVNDELRDDRQYTVFAPSNDAFAQIVPNADACYAAPACKNQLATILLDHIVPTRAYIDALFQAGPALPSLGNDLIHFEQADERHGIYRVEGHSVLRVHDNDVGLAYTIDGVLASDAQIAALQNAENSATPAATSGSMPANAAQMPSGSAVAPRGAP
jgi:uncharacterized surface protein with fasciclin (FAS1) repeats